MDGMLMQLWILLAGVCGAVLPLVVEDAPSRRQSMTRVACGALVAVFVGPALNERVFDDAGPHVQAGVAFLVGCFGLQVTAILQRLLRRRGDSLAERLVERVVGGDRRSGP